MKPSLSLKTLLRSPFKTFLTLLLLTVASFALFTRVAEYMVTAREFNRIASTFRGVGSAEYAMPQTIDNSSDVYLLLDERATDAIREPSEQYVNALIYNQYEPLTFEDIEALSALPYVNRTSTRYMTAGVSEDGYVRNYEIKGLYNYAHRLVVEASLSNVSGSGGGGGRGFNGPMSFTLRLTDINILAGAVDRVVSELYVRIYAYPDQYLTMENQTPTETGNSYQTSIFYPEITFGDLQNMRMGGRYVFSLRYVPGNTITRSYPLLPADRAAQTQWPTMVSLDGKPEDYLETEEFAALRDYIKLTEDDAHTFDIVYTDDMSAIMRFANKEMEIYDGRALNDEDIESGAAVCVVSKVFSQRNHVKVGDTITMRLGNSLRSQNLVMGSPSIISERASTEERVVELEIVGIYTDLDTIRLRMDNPFWNYSNNTIFVPLPLLNVSEEDRAAFPVSPGEFSFVIDDARDIAKFLEKSAPLVEELGLNLLFSDGGWPAMEQQFGTTGTLSLIAVLTLIAATLIAGGLTVFLFIGRKKRDYAIMRALGVPKRAANRALFLPLALVACIAVVGGTVAARISSGDITADALTAMQDSGYTVDASIPPSVILVCVMGQLAFICGIAFFGLWRLSLQQPLALLQAGAETARAKVEKPVPPAVQAPVTLGTLPKLDRLPRGYIAPRHILRLLLLRSRRAKLKTLLSVVLAALLFGTVVQFAALRETYQELYDSYELKSTFTGGLPMSMARELADSEYIKDAYYEYISDNDSLLGPGALDVNETIATLVMTNDLERFCGVPVELTFLEGYDESALDSNEGYCVLGATLMDSLGLELGDTVQIIQRGIKDYVTASYADDTRDAAILKRSAFYTVVGRMRCSNSEYNNRLYVAANTMLTAVYGGRHVTYLRMAEFTLADNARADEFVDYAVELVKAYTGRKSIYINTSELEQIENNMRLFMVLFPVVAVVLLLLGGLLPGLMILQSAKEASIFRVLGTTKLRTRSVLTLQQLLLCIAGLCVGGGIMLLYNGPSLFAAVSSTVLLCFILYCASCALLSALCSVSVTRHKVLELLQTKE